MYCGSTARAAESQPHEACTYLPRRHHGLRFFLSLFRLVPSTSMLPSLSMTFGKGPLGVSGICVGPRGYSLNEANVTSDSILLRASRSRKRLYPESQSGLPGRRKSSSCTVHILDKAPAGRLDRWPLKQVRRWRGRQPLTCTGVDTCETHVH